MLDNDESYDSETEEGQLIEEINSKARRGPMRLRNEDVVVEDIERKKHIDVADDHDQL